MPDLRDASTPGIAAPRPLAVVVMGISGSGKSTLGSALAAALGCSFLEGDDLHDPAAVARMAAGRPLGDADRWPWLDRIAQAANERVRADGIVVIACSALRRAYRDRLARAIVAPLRIVLPEASHDELLRRMQARQGHYMPVSLLASQRATLERPGPDEPVLTLDAALPPPALTRSVLAWLEARA